MYCTEENELSNKSSTKTAKKKKETYLSLNIYYFIFLDFELNFKANKLSSRDVLYMYIKRKYFKDF